MPSKFPRLEKKPKVEPINLNKFMTLRGFKQRVIVAEKLNEIINKLNLD